MLSYVHLGKKEPQGAPRKEKVNIISLVAASEAPMEAFQIECSNGMNISHSGIGNLGHQGPSSGRSSRKTKKEVLHN